MAITWQAAGAVSAASGTSVSPAYPASIAAGDLLILLVGMKPSTANSGSVTTPSGWTSVASLTGAGGYGATLGADTGNTNVWAFSKVADGTESGTLAVSVATNNVSWMTIHRLSNATGVWDVAGATGSDTSAGNVSVTFSSDPGVTSGDYIVAAMVIPTDVTTPTQFSAEAFSQTGVTFGTVTEVVEPDSTTGNDIGGFVIRAAVSSGTSSAAPVMTATAGGTTTNVRGPAVFVRAREMSATVVDIDAADTVTFGASSDAVLDVAADASATATVAGVATADVVAAPATPDRSWDFESGTVGVVVATSDTPSAGDTAFNNVTENTGSGGSFKYSNDTAANGSQSVKLSTGATAVSCYSQWNITGSGLSLYCRYYIYLPTGFSLSQRWDHYQPRDTATRIRHSLNTDDTLSIVNGSTVVGTSTATLSRDTWYRIEGQLLIDASAGAIELKLFVGNSTTAIETVTATGLNTGTTECTNVRIGNIFAFSNLGPLYLDDEALSFTGYMGPNVTTATHSADAAQTLTFTGAAAATVTDLADASATATFAGAATATVTDLADGTGTATFAGTATATVTDLASGTGTATFTGTATATVTDLADASATATFAGTATAASTKPVDASATATFGATADATTGLGGADAAGTLTFTGTATAASTKPVDASATLTAAGTGTVAATRFAAASQTIALAGAAIAASTKPVDATATATFAGTASATTTSASDIDGAATLTASGTASASSVKPVDAAGAATLAGSGAAAVTAAADAAAALTASGTATGTRTAFCAASGPLTASGTATVFTVQTAAASFALTLSGDASMSVDAVGSPGTLTAAVRAVGGPSAGAAPVGPSLVGAARTGAGMTSGTGSGATVAGASRNGASITEGTR